MYEILLDALCSMFSQCIRCLQRNVHVASAAQWFPIYIDSPLTSDPYIISLLLDRQSSSTLVFLASMFAPRTPIHHSLGCWIFLYVCLARPVCGGGRARSVPVYAWEASGIRCARRCSSTVTIVDAVPRVLSVVVRAQWAQLVLRAASNSFLCQTQLGGHDGQGMGDGHERVLPARQFNPGSVEAQLNLRPGTSVYQTVVAFVRDSGTREAKKKICSTMQM